MTRPADVRVGQLYVWAGKTWEVTRVWPVEGVAAIRNVRDARNTARLPLTQFRELATSIPREG